MSNALNVFAFESHAVRVIEREGAPWFIATDIASILGYRNAPDMVRMLDTDEAATHIVRSRSANDVVQERETTVISESGLYACILKSRRDEAKVFRKWVTAEVLPSIRKTGSYQQLGREGPTREVSMSAQHQADVLVSADRTFRSLMRAGRSAGVPVGAAVLRAREITQQRTGIDLFAELGLTPEQFQPKPKPVEPVPDDGWPDAGQVAHFYTCWRDGKLDAPYTVCTSKALYRRYVYSLAYGDDVPSHSSFARALGKVAGKALWRTHINLLNDEGRIRSVRAWVPKAVQAERLSRGARRFDAQAVADFDAALTAHLAAEKGA